MADLALVLVQIAGIEVADPIDGQAKAGRYSRRVRNLEMGFRGAEKQANTGIGIDNPRHVRETLALIGAIVERVIARGRVLDTDPIMQIFAGKEVVDGADPPAILEARLQPFMRATIHRDAAARIGRACL